MQKAGQFISYCFYYRENEAGFKIVSMNFISGRLRIYFLLPTTLAGMPKAIE